MKVLHILSELKHSGAEVMLQQAFERFSQHGIESHILSTGQVVGDYAAVLEDTGFKIHHIPFRKYPMFFMEVRQLLRRERFSTVHLHTETAFIWYVLLLNLAGVKTVVKTFHNVFLFTGYLRWKRALHRKISRRLFRTIQHAISDSVRDFEKKRFGNDCVLIRNWTDTNRFSPPNPDARASARRLYDIQPDDFVVVTTGSCTEIKNHIALFSAVRKVLTHWCDRSIIVLHVGSGPLVGYEKLYSRKYDIEKYCRFLGTLDDIRPCLYAADVFVMTSLWEGLGNAALEGMSAGLPALLYNVYGLKDLLQGGEGGLLIDPVEDNLADALLLMANDPDLRAKKGKEAREIVLRSYSLRESVDKLVDLYTSARGHSEGHVRLVESS